VCRSSAHRGGARVRRSRPGSPRGKRSPSGAHDRGPGTPVKACDATMCGLCSGREQNVVTGLHLGLPEQQRGKFCSRSRPGSAGSRWSRHRAPWRRQARRPAGPVAGAERTGGRAWPGTSSAAEHLGLICSAHRSSSARGRSRAARGLVAPHHDRRGCAERVQLGGVGTSALRARRPVGEVPAGIQRAGHRLGCRSRRCVGRTTALGEGGGAGRCRGRYRVPGVTERSG